LPVGQISPVGHACAAQHYRDARISAIYDGTNGIQSIGLLTRKLAANGGASMWALLDELKAIGGGVPPNQSFPPHGGSQHPDVCAAQFQYREQQTRTGCAKA
jgi:hypothetical protein